MPEPHTSAPEVLAPVGIGWRHAHYAKLLSQLPPLDFLEVHSENFFAEGGATLAVLNQGRSNYPISLHGVGLSLGSAIGLDDWHLYRLTRLVQSIDPVRVSDHACFARGQVNGKPVHASDLLPVPFTSRALQTMSNNVGRAQDQLKRTLLVENLTAYVEWNSPADEQLLAEVDFLNTLASRTGCGLLVDINNIYVNALNEGLAKQSTDATDEQILTHAMLACRQWLDTINPEFVGEIHLAGHCHVNDAYGNIYIDDHGSEVCQAVWQLYEYAVDRFGPVPTLIEWDTNLPELDVLLEQARLARVRATAPRALA